MFWSNICVDKLCHARFLEIFTRSPMCFFGKQCQQKQQKQAPLGWPNNRDNRDNRDDRDDGDDGDDRMIG